MYPVLRIGDNVLCTCFPPTTGITATPPIPCPNGNILEGSITTLIEDRGVSRLGDRTSNCCGGQCFCPNNILTGSFKTLVDNKPVARIIDTISCGKPTSGSVKTFIE